MMAISREVFELSRMLKPGMLIQINNKKTYIILRSEKNLTELYNLKTGKKSIISPTTLMWLIHKDAKIIVDEFLDCLYGD